MPTCAGTLSSRSRSGSTAHGSIRKSKILAGCTGPIALASWSGVRCPNFHAHSPQAEQRLLDEFAATIERDRDHPCIVAWVPMNETFGFPRPVRENELVSLLVRLYHCAHQLDETRPVVSNDGWEHG